MPAPPFHTNESNPIIRARLIIDEQYTRRLTLPEVAQAVNLSPTYLCRAFRKANGCTLVEYLSRRRTDKAQALLRETVLMVKEVAFSTGFQSIAHFNRVFKNASGVAPLEFRRQNTRGASGSVTAT